MSPGPEKVSGTVFRKTRLTHQETVPDTFVSSVRHAPADLADEGRGGQHLVPTELALKKFGPEKVSGTVFRKTRLTHQETVPDTFFSPISAPVPLSSQSLGVPLCCSVIVPFSSPELKGFLSPRYRSYREDDPTPGYIDLHLQA